MLTFSLHPVVALGLLVLICTGAAVVVDCVVSVVPRSILWWSLPVAALVAWAWVTR